MTAKDYLKQKKEVQRIHDLISDILDYEFISTIPDCDKISGGFTSIKLSFISAGIEYRTALSPKSLEPIIYKHYADVAKELKKELPFDLKEL
jgi:hypothetical protein